MAINIFAAIDGQLTTPVSQFVTDGVGNLASAAAAPLRSAVTLYVIIYGVAILRGLVTEPVMDFAWRAVKIVIIVTLVTQVSAYNEYVKAVFFDALPKEVAQAIAGGSGAPTANTFDQFLQKGFQAGQKIWEQAGITDPGPAFVAAIVFAATGVSVALAYGVYIYAQVALAIVLAVGPVFCAMALFNATRRFCESWIGQMANFVVLKVLVTVVLGLFLKVLDQYAATYATGGDVFVSALVFTAIGCLTAFVALQLPSIAAGLAGAGASIGLGVVGAGANWVSRASDTPPLRAGAERGVARHARAVPSAGDANDPGRSRT